MGESVAGGWEIVESATFLDDTFMKCLRRYLWYGFLDVRTAHPISKECSSEG